MDEKQTENIKTDTNEDPERNQKNRKRTKSGSRVLTAVRYLLILVCAAVAVYEGVQIYLDQREYQTADHEYQELADQAVQETAGTAASASDVSGTSGSQDSSEITPDLKVDYAALEKINPDFIGWLSFKALDISYPIVKEQKENEYIHATFDGKSNKAGCIFMDTLSNEKFDGRSDFVFGHNMRNLSMFGSLKLLYKKGNGYLLENNPYVFVYTKEGIYQYEVFAYETTQTGSSVYDEITTDDAYDAYVKAVRRRSMYECPDEIDFSKRPEILNLSTCSGAAGGTKRFVVHTVRIRTWENS